MNKKKRHNNKKNSQSNFAKLSIFQPQKYKFKKKCPLSGKGAPVVDYKNIKLLNSFSPLAKEQPYNLVLLKADSVSQTLTSTYETGVFFLITLSFLLPPSFINFSNCSLLFGDKGKLILLSKLFSHN